MKKLAVFWITLLISMAIVGCTHREADTPDIAESDPPSNEQKVIIPNADPAETDPPAPQTEPANANSDEKWINVRSLESVEYCLSTQAEQAFYQSLEGFGANATQAVEILGPPNEREVQEESWTFLQYDGLFLLCYTDALHDYVQFVALKNRQIELAAGPVIGTEREEVRRQLGEPSAVVEGHWVYCFEGVDSVYWVFYFQDDRVIEITWDIGCI